MLKLNVHIPLKWQGTWQEECKHLEGYRVRYKREVEPFCRGVGEYRDVLVDAIGFEGDHWKNSFRCPVDRLVLSAFPGDS